MKNATRAAMLTLAAPAALLGLQPAQEPTAPQPAPSAQVVEAAVEYAQAQAAETPGATRSPR
jgi:hypothetical protein